MAYPTGLDALQSHPVDEDDLVLQLRRPLPQDKKRGPDFELKTFGSRPDANRALRDGQEH